MSAYHIQKHEKGCTNNPNRECGLCRKSGLEQKPLNHCVDLLSINENCELIGFDKLREYVENCPACLLATLRQFGKGMPEWYPWWPDFDFKKELALFWQTWNEENNHV